MTETSDRQTLLETKSHEIQEILRRWAEQENILQAGEQLVVHFEVKRAETVTVIVEIPEKSHKQKLPGSTPLKKFESLIGNRPFNALANQDITTLEKFLATPPEELLKIRNFGKACLGALINGLKKEGIEYPYPLPRGVNGSLSARDKEVLRAEVRKLTKRDWETILAMNWNGTKHKVVVRFRNADNKPQLGKGFFPTMTAPHEMNNAFRSNSLPYRIKATVIPKGPHAAQDRKFQIAVLPD
jgi:hypothetical protein